jgi:peptidoglycan/xylan/chitin deacetylase (PgdA/CDA1 family)
VSGEAAYAGCIERAALVWLTSRAHERFGEQVFASVRDAIALRGGVVDGQYDSEVVRTVLVDVVGRATDLYSSALVPAIHKHVSAENADQVEEQLGNALRKSLDRIAAHVANVLVMRADIGTDPELPMDSTISTEANSQHDGDVVPLALEDPTTQEQPSSTASPYLAGVTADRKRSPLRGRASLSLSLFLMTVCIGVAALAWQSYGGVAEQTMANWVPRLGLAPILAVAPNAPPPPAAATTAPPVTMSAMRPPALARILMQAPTEATPAQAPTATPTAPSCPGNPDALGIARIVEVDTTGGPGFGSEYLSGMDFLRPGEVVLTFDDGPWPNNTPKVLAALAHHCTKAIFFPIGLHATYEPDLLKQVAAAGHTIGSHTWCHQDLSKTKGTCRENGRTQLVDYNFKDEIEKGISAVRWAVGAPIAPFFRFPALRQPLEALAYLGRRNIAIFSIDMDTFDFTMRNPEQVRQSVMTKLKKQGKGIILMHDFQQATADAIGDILNDLKVGGYKVVQMRARGQLNSLPEYDAIVMQEIKAPTVSTLPVESVVGTIQGN